MAARKTPATGAKPRADVAAPHAITFRLTPGELAALDAARGAKTRSTWIRERLALTACASTCTL